MKKKILAFFIFAIILVLSGCKFIKTEKHMNTVTCSRDRMNLGIKYKQEIIGVLTGDKIESAKLN